MDESAESKLITLRRRLLGAAILIKTVLPVLVVSLLLYGFACLAYDLSRAMDRAAATIEPKVVQAQAELVKVRAESKRLLHEAAKIKNETQRIAGDVKRSIEPIRASLKGITDAVRVIAGAVEKLLNGLVDAANKIPWVKLQHLHLIPSQFKGFELPNLHVDVNLTPDFTALNAFKQEVDAISVELGNTLQDLGVAFLAWLKLAKVVAALIGAWLLLIVVAFFYRAVDRVRIGWQLLRGIAVLNAALYF